MATEKFHFTGKDGEKYSIPYLNKLPFGAIRKSRHETSEENRFYSILELTLGEGSKELDAIDMFDPDELADFLAEWKGEAPFPKS